MKLKTLITAAFALLLSTSAFSQDIKETLKSMTPEQKAMAMTMVLKTKLNLDSNQTAKVKAINLKYGPKTEAALKSDGGKFAKFKQIREIQKDKDAELKEVLTADQFKQYQAIEEEMKEKMKERLKDRKQS